MAVTLTSTGITFEDGNSQNSAAVGGNSHQVFNNSGTWSHSGSGSPNMVLAYGVGGSGGGRIGYNGYQSAPWRYGGGGGGFIAEPFNTTGNVAVTIGNGGAGNNFFCGSYSYSCSRGQAGNATSVGSVTGNGGGAWYAYYNGGSPGASGTGTGIVTTLSGPQWTGSGPAGYYTGSKGQAYIVW
jgi:hypothetical protein